MKPFLSIYSLLLHFKIDISHARFIIYTKKIFITKKVLSNGFVLRYRTYNVTLCFFPLRSLHDVHIYRFFSFFTKKKCFVFGVCFSFSSKSGYSHYLPSGYQIKRICWSSVADLKQHMKNAEKANRQFAAVASVAAYN